nr:DUF6477 family protein [Roseicyclus sp.]
MTKTLAAMLRPRLLITAARMAALTHDAQRRAKRRPVAVLLAEEDKLNTARLGDGLGYSPSRHVAVMSALLCAARNQAGAR